MKLAYVGVVAISICALSGSCYSAENKPTCSGPVVQYDNCFGKSTSSDGASYIGEWQKGLPHGQGEMLLPNGDKYIGTFSEGQAEGLAIVYYPDGQKHVGTYKRDRLEGVVILYGSDGSTRTVSVYEGNTEKQEQTQNLRDQLKEAMGAAKLSDFETAFDIWMPLAQKGNAEAQYNIAIMNEHGEGIPQDHALAHDWMQKAASQHHPMAQYYLGVYFKNGIGVQINKASAYQWMAEAAKNGVLDAQRETALNLIEGVGVATNRQQAMYWFAVAALNRDLYSALEIGNAFSDGRVVKRDRLRAYQWYLIASGYQGPNFSNVEFRDSYASPIADKKLDELSKSLKKSDIAKAKAMTDKCLVEGSLNAAFKTCGLSAFNL